MAALRVALAQINPTVGDIAGNARLINEYTAQARSEEASVVVFPELALTGYPPEDLLLKTHFLDAVGDALEDIAAQTQGIVAVVGFPERADDVYNAAALLADGKVARGLPQDVPAQLRRLRRAALLPERPAPSRVRARRRDGRGHRLRRHLGARPAGDHRGAGGGAADREPVRLALPRRQGQDARAHARPARAGQPDRRGLLQQRGRPGRAGLRRSQPAARLGRAGRGSGAAVRGVADGGDHRPGRSRGRAPARSAPPHQRPPPPAAGRRRHPPVRGGAPGRPVRGDRPRRAR